MLKVDLSNVWGDLSLPDLLATEQEGVRVLLRVSFAPDSVLPEATAQIQREVKDYVQTHAGVPVTDVQIFVEAVGSPQPVRVE